jgi:hypothetical protein
MAKTKDALKILARVTGGDSAVRQGIANERINLEVAQMIYDARTKPGCRSSHWRIWLGRGNL